MYEMPHKLGFRGDRVEEGLLGRGNFTRAKTSLVQAHHLGSWGNNGPKGRWGPSSQVRNVGRQYGASDGRYSQRQGFQEIDRAKTYRANEGSLEAVKSGGPAHRFHVRSRACSECEKQGS